MSKFVVFHNAADDSYINTVENFRGAKATEEVVTAYFRSAASGGLEGAAYDAIAMVCTNGEEDRALEQLAHAMTRNMPVQIIADDVNSVYACQNITSVTSITLAASGNIKDVIAATFTTADTGGVDNRIIAYNYDSGGIFTVNAGTDASSTIYLPTTPITGWNAKFICNHPSDGHTITITAGGASTAFMGVTLQAGDTVEHTGTTSAVIAASDFKLGDFFEVTYDGNIFHIEGIFDTASSLAVS